jgi:hypothetical protein
MLLQFHPLKALDFDSSSHRRETSLKDEDGRSDWGYIDGFALSNAAAQVITEGPVCMLRQRQVFIAMPRTLKSAFILTWANKVVSDLNKI